MEKVLQMRGKIKDSQIKGESHLNSLSKAMNFLTNKFDEYDRERQENKKIIDSVKSDKVNINEKIEKLERTVDTKKTILTSQLPLTAQYCRR